MNVVFSYPPGSIVFGGGYHEEEPMTEVNDALNRKVLGPESPVNVTVGFLVHMVVMLVAILGVYFSIRTDLQNSLRAGAESHEQLEIQRKDINELTIQIVQMRQELADYRENYNRDMNTYIREPRK